MLGRRRARHGRHVADRQGLRGDAARRPRHRREPGQVGLVGRAHPARLPRGPRLDPGAEVVERLGRHDRRLVHGHHVVPDRRGRRRARQARQAARRQGDLGRRADVRRLPRRHLPRRRDRRRLHPAVARADHRAVEPAAVDPHRPTPPAAAHLRSTTCATATTSPRRRSSAPRSASDDAYDGPFYRLRSPGDRAAQIKVPVVITGGWWDIFQRGEPLLYEQLVNSPDKKLFMSPHYHTGGGPALPRTPSSSRSGSTAGSRACDNGVEDTPSVNLYPMGGDKWEHYPRWPVPGIEYTPRYLGRRRGAGVRASPPRAAATRRRCCPSRARARA